ncbi:hypothetical protein L7F22_005724 [Adiantum nelumboides]|nr:hypothetical protein [Adiantum nelumboides]
MDRRREDQIAASRKDHVLKDLLMLHVEGQQLITSTIEAKLNKVWDDTMGRLAGGRWSDPDGQGQQALVVYSGEQSLDPEDSPEQHTVVMSTVIVQLNKELTMLKEMNEKNAKQAEDYKDKYYRASKKAKRMTEEASKWYDFQEEIRKLEVERESTVNSLQNNLATALKKQAAYAKRKNFSKEDIRANKKTIELTEKMIAEAN